MSCQWISKQCCGTAIRVGVLPYYSKLLLWEANANQVQMGLAKYSSHPSHLAKLAFITSAKDSSIFAEDWTSTKAGGTTATFLK